MPLNSILRQSSALLAKLLPLTVADEKASEVPQVMTINFIGMEPVQFGDAEAKRLANGTNRLVQE